MLSLLEIDPMSADACTSNASTAQRVRMLDYCQRHEKALHGRDARDLVE
jgi:hypothetical protein